MKASILFVAFLTLLSCRQVGKESKASPTSTDAAAPAVSTTSSPSTHGLTDQEIAEGWTSLFDGKTTSGWHVYQRKSDGSAWKVDSGYLYLDPSKKVGSGIQTKVVGGGDLISDSTFEDFHLSLEWRISPKGNSGILFGIQDDPQYEYCWFTGPEMQILDNDGHPDGKISKHRAGNLYDLLAAGVEPVKPVGEWNKAEIRFVKGNLECWLNGYAVVEVFVGDASWRLRVKESKFKDMPGFAAFKSGHIGLQDHGDPVWFRNIKIRRL
jgi:hypothetical protein